MDNEGSKSSLRPQQIQKLATLWIHGDQESKEDVTINFRRFEELEISDGEPLQIILLKAPATTATTGVKPRVEDEQTAPVPGRAPSKTAEASAHVSDIKSRVATYDENGKLLPGRPSLAGTDPLIFVAKSMTAEQQARQSQMQISVHKSIAELFGLRSRATVLVATANEEEHSASYVEISFRDEYLSRSEMWRLASSALKYRAIYVGQKILFLNTIKATVKEIYVSGETVKSAYYGGDTKPVFRSESARYIIFLQMSYEMWNFDCQNTGDTLFDRLVHGFMPDLFKRWTAMKARHLVSVIMFTRVEHLPAASYADEAFDSRSSFAVPRPTSPLVKDYYRVVVNEMASFDWVQILHHLKKEFRNFRQEIGLVTRDTRASLLEAQQTLDDPPEARYEIETRAMVASKGNLLEAICLASTQFSKDHIDRDLTRTGISVMVISPGNGIFDVDQTLLKVTTDILVGTGIGIDLVCLSPPPLNMAPVFRYRNVDHAKNLPTQTALGEADGSPRHLVSSLPDESTPRQTAMMSAYRPLRATDDREQSWVHGMPYWVNISFWPETGHAVITNALGPVGLASYKQSDPLRMFESRCPMYEIQMMGITENEMSNISIQKLQHQRSYPATLRLDHIVTTRVLDAGKELASEIAREADDEDESTEQDGNTRGKAGSDPLRGDGRRRNSLNGLTGTKALLSQYAKSYDVSLQVSSELLRFPGSGSMTALKQPSVSSRRASLKTGSPRKPPPPVHADISHRLKTLPETTAARSPERHSVNDDTTQTRDFSDPRAGQKAPVPSEATSLAHSQKLRNRGEAMDGEVDLSLALVRSNSTTTSVVSRPTKPSGLLRHISFGSSKSAVSKATASTSVSSGEVKPAAMSNKPLLETKHVLSKKDIKSRDGMPTPPINIRRPSIQLAHTDSGRTLVESTPSREPTPPGSKASSAQKESLFLVASSRTMRDKVGRRPVLSTSAGNGSVSGAFAPTDSLAPWLLIVNPCNPKKNQAQESTQYRRWQHVFPRRSDICSVKWESLCTPASVPLTTEFFPTASELSNDYHESTYKITLNEEDPAFDTPKTRSALLKLMIGFRLQHGFQFVVGERVAKAVGIAPHAMSRVFDPDFAPEDGKTIFMTVGNSIQQLICQANDEVEVRRFQRKPSKSADGTVVSDAEVWDTALIRTALEKDYHRRDSTFSSPRDMRNWNTIDMFLAGYSHDYMESLQFSRARFVLIPVALPASGRRQLPTLAEDSEEEVRLEGIRRITQMWQKQRFASQEEHRLPTKGRKQVDPNPLAIEYQTRDPSVVVAAGLESTVLVDGDPGGLPSQLFSELETYHTSSVDIQKLAQVLQSEHGIPIVDRRWHLKLHYNCFVGFDLTSWLQHRFRDVETRDDAVELGNRLMKEGLFQHVSSKHRFRDGQYFYQIASEHRAPREGRGGWLGSRRVDRSVPSTPIQENRSSPISARKRSESTSSSSDGSGEKTPTRPSTPKRKVALSRMMRFDLDPRKRSDRPEVINLHYERLHNPDNCYHIRIEWVTATPKFIQDAVVNWATTAEQFGLKLVELPIAEASVTAQKHPFRAPYLVRLAVQPPDSSPPHYFDTTHLGPSPKTDKYAFHKALLRRLDFVLDIEAASSFPADVEVMYSWGMPDYTMTQFIHESGLLLAQITKEGDFLLLANRLCSNRVSALKDIDKYEDPNVAYDKRIRSHQTASPYTSPFPRAVLDPFARGQKRDHGEKSMKSAEELKQGIEWFCSNENALREFYGEALKPHASPSPRFPSMSSEASIPSLGLPPSLAARDSSPAARL